MRIAALILALAVGGCALAAARGPELPVRAEKRPDCNSGKGGVFADGLAATVLGVAALALLSDGEGGVGAVMGLGAAGFVGSAVSGSGTADRCRAALREHEQLLAARDRDQGDGDWAAPRRPTVPIEPPVDEPQRVVVAPPVVPTPPVPAVTTPAVVAKPPPVPAARPAADDEAGDEEDASDADWSEFWREVKP